MSGILFVVKSVQGKSHPRPSRYDRGLKTSNGKTVGLLLRYDEEIFCHPGGYVIIDTGSRALKGLIRLRKRGVFLLDTGLTWSRVKIRRIILGEVDVGGDICHTGNS